jgi:hypothetical protein
MKKAIILATSAIILSASANAAGITWGSSQAVSTGSGNSSDVSTQGAFHHAVAGEFTNGGPSDYTVNGVLFTGVGGGTAVADLWTAGNSGDSAYNGLLSETNFGLGGSSFTLNLGDSSALGGAALTAAQEYQIQMFYVDQNTPGRTVTFGDGEMSPSTVDLLATNGQYAIGTFTASGATQSITMLADGFSQVQFSAFQVRAIPEPSAAALLLGLGGFALVLRRRK